MNWPQLQVNNSRTIKGWNLLQCGIGTVASAWVSGIEVFVVVVVVVLRLFVTPLVIFVDRPSTRLSADASALVSVLFAYVSAYSVPVPVVALFLDVVLAFHERASRTRPTLTCRASYLAEENKHSLDKLKGTIHSMDKAPL